MSTYQLTPKEINAVLSTEASTRYEYLIKRVADWGEIWTLRDQDGFLLFGDGSGRECVPVWPFAAYANLCCINEWSGAMPIAINLDDFLERWIPGLERDKRLVAVFPTPRAQAAVVLPFEFKASLQTALSELNGPD